MKFFYVVVIALRLREMENRRLATSENMNFICHFGIAVGVGEIEKVYRWMQIIFYYSNETGFLFKWICWIFIKIERFSFSFLSFLIHRSYCDRGRARKKANCLGSFLELLLPRLLMNKLSMVGIAYLRYSKIVRSIDSVWESFTSFLAVRAVPCDQQLKKIW